MPLLGRRSPNRDRFAKRTTNLRIPALVFLTVYCVLLLCLPSQLIFRPLGAPGTPANMCGLAALLWWVCATVGGQNPTRGVTPVRVTVGLLVAAVFASYACGMLYGWYAPPDAREANNETWTLLPTTVDQATQSIMSAANRGLLSFGGWVGIVLLTADGLRSWKDLERLIAWLSWLATFVAVLGIIQYFTGLDIASFFKIPGLSANSEFGAVSARSILNRVSSTAVHPIEFGVVLSAIFPLSLHRTIYNWGSKLALAPTILIGIAMPMAVSRSGVLVLAVAFIPILIGWPPRWRNRAFLIAPVAIVGIRLMAPGLVGTIFSLFRSLNQDTSVTGRTADYAIVGRLFHDHVWLGRGLFTFVPHYYRVLDNQYLDILVELGLVGMTAVLILFLVGYCCARGARRRTVEARQRNLALMIAGSIAGVAVSYVTFDAWSLPMASGVTFLLIGMAGAAWQISVEEASRRPVPDLADTRDPVSEADVQLV